MYLFEINFLFSILFFLFFLLASNVNKSENLKCETPANRRYLFLSGMNNKICPSLDVGLCEPFIFIFYFYLLFSLESLLQANDLVSIFIIIILINFLLNIFF